MAILSHDDILKLAQLARLSLSDEEVESFINEISSILNYVEQLNEVETDNLEPTNQVTGLVNVWRPDKVINYGYQVDDILKIVPKMHDRYIRVGRMIE